MRKNHFFFDDNVVNTNDLEHLHEDTALFQNEAPPNASGYTSFTVPKVSVDDFA
jgi:hypothetical protein